MAGGRDALRDALPRDPGWHAVQRGSAIARGRDALPRDPGWHVAEACFRFPPCELADGMGISAVSSFTGRATPDRAGARPYHR